MSFEDFCANKDNHDLYGTGDRELQKMSYCIHSKSSKIKIWVLGFLCISFFHHKFTMLSRSIP